MKIALVGTGYVGLFTGTFFAKIGNTVKVVYKELPVDDSKQRQPDITKARNFLGWEPKVERAEGLQKTYDYFKALPPSEWAKFPKEFISK